MERIKTLTYIFILLSFCGFSQDQEKTFTQTNDLISQANDLVQEDFVNAEVEYRKAISKTPSNTIGTYNLGNAYYESGLYDEALLRHMEAATSASSKNDRHRAFHNIGNALMKQNLCQEAVEMFKNALRNDPTDEETRYNFALAKECAEQQGQGDDDENEDENEDEKENEDKEDKKDDGDENEDKKDEEGNDEEKKNDGDDKEDDNGKPDEKEGDKVPQKEDQKKEQQQGKLSPQQVKNLLEAMNNQEKKVQEKINAKKAKGPKVRAEKDW
ncbi:MAG: aerotolerance regulator BatC [Flavobacteriaceae bacterium]|nr:aerotolerance regulator BatC [Flavobacteriaceae bacterium]